MDSANDGRWCVGSDAGGSHRQRRWAGPECAEEGRGWAIRQRPRRPHVVTTGQALVTRWGHVPSAHGHVHFPRRIARCARLDGGLGPRLSIDTVELVTHRQRTGALIHCAGTESSALLDLINALLNSFSASPSLSGGRRLPAAHSLPHLRRAPPVRHIVVSPRSGASAALSRLLLNATPHGRVGSVTEDARRCRRRWAWPDGHLAGQQLSLPPLLRLNCVSHTTSLRADLWLLFRARARSSQ